MIEESSGQSVDSMYHPEFLFESVVIPCFNIGQVLAKANPIVPSLINKKTRELVGEDQMKLRRTELNKKFSALSFLFAMEMVIDIFSVLRTMTAESMSKIRLDQVVPANYLQDNGDYLFGTCTKIYSSSGKVHATARLQMSFGVKKGNMLSLS